jgi:hypothetical protein
MAITNEESPELIGICSLVRTNYRINEEVNKI